MHIRMHTYMYTMRTYSVTCRLSALSTQIGPGTLSITAIYQLSTGFGSMCLCVTYMGELSPLVVHCLSD